MIQKVAKSIVTIKIHKLLSPNFKSIKYGQGQRLGWGEQIPDVEKKSPGPRSIGPSERLNCELGFYDLRFISGSLFLAQQGWVL
jgi:hypothetical protein